MATGVAAAVANWYASAWDLSFVSRVGFGVALFVVTFAATYGLLGLISVLWRTRLGAREMLPDAGDFESDRPEQEAAPRVPRREASRRPEGPM